MSPAATGTRPRTGEGAACARARAAFARIAEVDRPEVWIALRPEADVLADAARVDAALARGAELPLAGRLVAVKDNVDVAGLPTTAGCPGYAYEPAATAPAIARLVAAGAIVLGKTNLDQFATGLVGTRSPYGAVRNAWRPERISGGSSSGSAVAVALGIADIGISTDTAGSGRIPAALQGIAGVKPTRGTVPMSGVVPACRSYDCLGAFAATVAAAEEAVAVMAGPPGGLAWPADAPLGAPPAPVVAVPLAGQLADLSPAWAARFEETVRALEAGGAAILRVDVEAFLEGGRMLYESALVSERYAAVGDFVDAHAGSVDPTVGGIVRAARAPAAHELVRGLARLERLRDRALETISGADALLLPTAPGHPTLAAVAADPLGVNGRLGRYASFCNPFDMAAVAVPAGEAGGGPFGVTVFARAFGDRVAADLARRIAGEPPRRSFAGPPAACLLLVLGAHMRGEPLNGELTGRGGCLVRQAATAARYRMFALPTSPPKPGLVEVAAGGAPVEGELWALPPAALGALLAALPAPMTLGPVELAGGEVVTGFFCQSAATEGAEEITRFGGWRAYRAAAPHEGRA